MQDFFNNLNWVMLLKAFVVGGLICIIGQILIDKTKLTPARILVIFVTSGAILRSIMNISTFSRFCRCRCKCSFNWFWKLISKRSYWKSSTKRTSWRLYRWYCRSRWWNCRSNILWLYCFSGFKTKNEKTIIRKVALPHFSSRRFEFPNKMRKSQRQ